MTSLGKGIKSAPISSADEKKIEQAISILSARYESSISEEDATLTCLSCNKKCAVPYRMYSSGHETDTFCKVIIFCSKECHSAREKDVSEFENNALCLVCKEKSNPDFKLDFDSRISYYFCRYKHMMSYMEKDFKKHNLGDVNVFCSFCSKVMKRADKEHKKCGRCEMEIYCSKGCQVAHWPEHKKNCKKK